MTQVLLPLINRDLGWASDDRRSLRDAEICDRSWNGAYGISRLGRDHSPLMFAALMIGHHFSISAL